MFNIFKKRTEKAADIVGQFEPVLGKSLENAHAKFIKRREKFKDVFLKTRSMGVRIIRLHKLLTKHKDAAQSFAQKAVNAVARPPIISPVFVKKATDNVNAKMKKLAEELTAEMKKAQSAQFGQELFDIEENKNELVKIIKDGQNLRATAFEILDDFNKLEIQTFSIKGIKKGQLAPAVEKQRNEFIELNRELRNQLKTTEKVIKTAIDKARLIRKQDIRLAYRYTKRFISKLEKTRDDVHIDVTQIANMMFDSIKNYNNNIVKIEKSFLYEEAAIQKDLYKEANDLDELEKSYDEMISVIDQEVADVGKVLQ